MTYSPPSPVGELARLSVWHDGDLVGPDDARASVWDHGLLYGDGVFDGLRVRSGLLYRPAEHLGRLRRSARAVGIDGIPDERRLLDAITAVCRANRLADAHVRVIVTRGIGLPGLDPRRAMRPSSWVLAYPFPPTLGEEPLRLITSGVARTSPRSIPATAKTLNYLDGVLAKLHANVAGADDAVMLDEAGLVAEATAANLFCVVDGRLRTPLCTAALPGITRRTVLELAAERDIPAEETLLTTGDLHVADEAFLTGTAAGVVPIGSLDGRTMPAAPGPITATLMQAYAETWRHPGYSTPILAPEPEREGAAR